MKINRQCCNNIFSGSALLKSSDIFDALGLEAFMRKCRLRITLQGMCTSKTTRHVTITFSKFALKIYDSLSCDSSNVICMFHCTVCVCRKQFIAQTETSFRIRINNHKSLANTLANLSPSKHVGLLGHSFEKLNATIRVITTSESASPT